MSRYSLVGTAFLFMAVAEFAQGERLRGALWASGLVVCCIAYGGGA